MMKMSKYLGGGIAGVFIFGVICFISGLFTSAIIIGVNWICTNAFNFTPLSVEFNFKSFFALFIMYLIYSILSSMLILIIPIVGGLLLDHMVILVLLSIICIPLILIASFFILRYALDVAGISYLNNWVVLILWLFMGSTSTK